MLFKKIHVHSNNVFEISIHYFNKIDIYNKYWIVLFFTRYSFIVLQGIASI